MQSTEHCLNLPQEEDNVQIMLQNRITTTLIATSVITEKSTPATHSRNMRHAVQQRWQRTWLYYALQH